MKPANSRMLAQRRGIGRNGFVPITVGEYVKRHVSRSPRVDPKELTLRLRRALEAKLRGAVCECGEPIWALGSAEVGFACFTCVTGEAVPDNDYENVGVG